jgi:hypothetical protein
MDHSEYLSQKKMFNFQSTNKIHNASVVRLQKFLLDNNFNETVTINTNIFNNKIQYAYTSQPMNQISVNTFTVTGNNELFIFKNSSCVLTMLSNFYSIGKINSYLDDLMNDNYESVFNDLNTDLLHRIKFDLFQIKTMTQDSCIREIVDIYSKMTYTIQYFYFLHGDIESKQIQFENYKKDSEILNDPEKLKEYLANLRSNVSELTNLNVNVKKLEIKPEYLEYIKLYGVPYKTSFDPYLLQEIKDRLQSVNNDTNTLTITNNNTISITNPNINDNAIDNTSY